MPLLIVEREEPRLARRLQVEEERFTIGRARSSGVSIEDRSVSKVHLLISRTPEGYTFQDLFSQNGTYLNEERRDSGTLKDGDVLRLGRVRVRFYATGAPLAVTGEAAALPASPGSGSRVSREEPPAVASVPSAQASPEAPTELLQGEGRGPKERSGHRLAPGARGTYLKIALVCAGCLAVVLALAAGRLDSLFSSAEPAGRDGTAGVTTTVAVEAPVPPVAPEPEPEPEPGSRRTPEGRGGRDGDAGEAGGLSEAAGGLLAAIRKPYAGPEASARVLFRMSLDLLERPPTRAEARSLLPLGHEERWARLRAMAAAPSSPDRDMSSWAFSAFLGRRPRAGECEALEEALDALRRTGKEGDPPAEAGLLLTATEEYRSPEFLRKRSPRQHARSLLVDLLDRPPAPEEEADLEQVLSEYPGGWAAARVILHSPEAAGAVPRLPPDDAARAPAARAFLEEEFLRFLGRRPREEEVRELEREVLETPDGPRWVRLGLVSTPGYRSY